ncbi:MAG TPA: hypothetical protein VJV03_14185 [Pyrinomonadaceae bacterium]|nr:hypothetical protein [Pyrinomonadaceae bacterium]
MKVHLWQILTCGAVIGLIVGVLLEIGRQMQNARTIGPDFLKPEVIPVTVAFLFATLGAAVWFVWIRKSR